MKNCSVFVCFCYRERDCWGIALGIAVVLLLDSCEIAVGLMAVRLLWDCCGIPVGVLW